MTKQRLALAMLASDMPFDWQKIKGEAQLLFPIPEKFWTTQTFLANRATCEDDKDIQQLLPYNVLLADEDSKIFMYSRAGNGAEARLHGKLSIGVGGHVDVAPKTTNMLFWTLRSEAQREIEEETGVIVHPGSIMFEALLCDKEDHVGSVHTGLLSLNVVTAAEVAGIPEEAIDNGEWVSLEDLRATYFDRLENWSKLAVVYMEFLASQGKPE